MVDSSRIGKEPQHDAPQDHVRVSCKKKPPSDTWLGLSSTFSHPGRRGRCRKMGGGRRGERRLEEEEERE